MIIALPGGRVAQTGFHYENRLMDPTRNKPNVAEEGKGILYRVATLAVTIKNGEEVVGEFTSEAYCHPNDNFDKTKAHQLVWKRLLEKDPNHTVLSRPERTTIALKLFNFSPKKEKVKKAPPSSPA